MIRRTFWIIDASVLDVLYIVCLLAFSVAVNHCHEDPVPAIHPKKARPH